MRTKDVLQKLFSEQKIDSIQAVVVRRIRLGRYELIDDLGKVFQADSSINWSPKTRVVVQSGRIQTSVTSNQSIKSYEV